MNVEQQITRTVPKHFYSSVSVCAYIFAIFMAVVSPFSSAIDRPKIQLTGFGTIGLSKGGNDELGVRQNYSQHGEYGGWQFKTDSSLGLQVNADFNEKFDAIVQLIARDQVHSTLERSVEWAFLRYRPSSEIDIRVGRMALDLFNISEYRSVGFAYLWARPPTEFYGPIPLSNIDGIDIMFSKRVAGGILQSKLFVGEARDYMYVEGEKFEVSFKPTYGMNLSYQLGAWKARFTVAATKFSEVKNDVGTELVRDIIDSTSVEIWPDAPLAKQHLDLRGAHLRYSSLGLVYDHSGWVVQSELSHISSRAALAPSNNAGYLSVGKRVASGVTLYGNYARVLTELAPVYVRPPVLTANANLNGFYSFVNELINVNRIDQYSYSAGLHWDIRPTLTMKIQWDHVHVEKKSAGLYTTFSDRSNDIELDNFSLTFNFVF